MNGPPMDKETEQKVAENKAYVEGYFGPLAVGFSGVADKNDMAKAAFRKGEEDKKAGLPAKVPHPELSGRVVPIAPLGGRRRKTKKAKRRQTKKAYSRRR